MTIEFHCPACTKLLRTSDDKAGVTAKCPQCGGPITVPAAAGVPADVPAEDDDGDGFGDAADVGRASPPLPAAGGSATKLCPMCGETIQAAAIRCRFCGEDVSARGRPARVAGRPVPLDVGSVFNRAWKIFQSQMGLCVAASLIVLVIGTVIGFGFGLVGGVLKETIARADRDLVPIGAGIGFLFTNVLPQLVNCFFQLGQVIFFLKVARGEPAEISDLFAGGPWYLRMVAATLLFNLMVGFGFVACIVPGVILAIMFWPYSYLLVDQNLPGIDSLGRAKDITAGQWGQIFVLGLAIFGINLAGVLALCVGVLFSIPLTVLMGVVAYHDLTGQRTCADA